MSKALVFDMDGTLANLYGVKDWLSDLRNENPRPYKVANPMYDMEALATMLNLFRDCGWKIVVTSWLAKGSSKSYDDEVRKAKKAWLEKYNFPYDEIHLIKYGTTKADCTRNKYDYQILIDDNEKIRKGWTLGDTIDATKDIFNILLLLLINEL